MSQELSEKEVERIRGLIDASRRDVYESLMEARKTALDLQGHYGKWLVSSLLLIHGAAIGFIAQSDRLSQKLIPDVFAIAVVGLILALLCGFSTWINWGLSYIIHNSVHPMMVLDDDYWPKFHEHKASPWMTCTFWLSIVTGIASVLCIIYGSYEAAGLLRVP